MDKEENKRNESGQGRPPRNEDEQQSLQSGISRDISDIDRQEGDMEHGELGGNFKKNKEDEKR